MEKVQALLASFALPFVYLYTLTRMIFTLPSLFRVAVSLKSWHVAGVGLSNTLTVLLLVIAAFIQAVAMPVLLLVGVFISIAGPVSGVIAFSVLVGATTSLLINPVNMQDLIALGAALTLCSIMAVAGVILWASNSNGEAGGEDDE